MAKLKVLMMGGRRCGKTSALASLFYQMIHGATNEFLTVSDNTILETKIDPITKKEEKQESLLKKRMELEYFISKGGNNTFLVDKGPTRMFWYYNLQIQIPGTSKKTTIEFRDSNGEFFEAGGKYHSETIEYIKDCDVFVVVVDTPYLMVGSKVENEAANVVESLHTFLTHIDNDNGRKAKQVIFLPIKCEKWVKDGKIEDVVAKIETTYEATIKHLKATGKTEISIIPIQTAGDIVFSELREPYLLVDTKTGKKSKCSMLGESGRMVVLEDGKNHKVTESEIINPDPEGVFPETDIVRSAAWYNLSKGINSSYSPYNCEQLPLHIIRFMFNKLTEESPGGIWGSISSFLFGTITKNDLSKALKGLNDKNLIKDSDDGIKILKKCF